jgi:two-component system chemotaxis sensor kinase CheA
MDVVRTNLERLGGTVDVRSEEGIGTKITIRLPITPTIDNVNP